MKIVKGLLIGVALLALLLFGGGLLLPAGFTVQRSASIGAPPDQVYAAVADPRRWNDWGEWNRRDRNMQITYFGPPSGVGAGWEWKSQSQGDGRMTFTAAEPGQRVAFDLFFPDFGTTSKGELRFAPEASGTRVTWTMQGDMGRNPLYHWMALFMDGMVGKDFDAGLANLKQLVEKR